MDAPNEARIVGERLPALEVDDYGSTGGEEAEEMDQVGDVGCYCSRGFAVGTAERDFGALEMEAGGQSGEVAKGKADVVDH